jgi:hypothetical protein
MHDEMIGKKIGNYVVTEFLGRGGMGTVYLAKHPEIGRQGVGQCLLPRCFNGNGLFHLHGSGVGLERRGRGRPDIAYSDL